MTKKKLSFFKIVSRDDFTRLLCLPDVFMQKYGSDFPRNVKLRMHSGRTWDVKVETMDDDDDDDARFCFKTGWDVFAKDIALKSPQFMFFTLDPNDGYTLHVSVYGTNGCFNDDDEDDDNDDYDGEDDEEEDDDEEEEDHNDDYDGEDDELEEDDDDEEEDHNDDYDGEDDEDEEDDDCDEEVTWKWPFRKIVNPLYYEFVLKKHNRYILTLKRRFVEASGLMGKHKVEVVGKYRKLWVGLNNTRNDKGRFDLAHRWADFLKINNMEYGNKYSIQFKSNTNAIHIDEVV